MPIGCGYIAVFQEERRMMRSGEEMERMHFIELESEDGKVVTLI